MKETIDLSRRQSIKLISLSTLSIPVLGMLGCGSSAETKSAAETTLASTSDTTMAVALTITTTSDTVSSATSTTTTTRSWASGTTELISVEYPDDSLFDESSACLADEVETLTVGPCYLGVENREDISDGESGLPMQLCLQLIDSNCNPLEGYLIEVWHCNNEGIYSGNTSASDDTSTFSVGFCTENESAALASTWYRGELTTDGSGRVNFKSCFPGWYPSRTAHIHFRVRLSNGGSDYVVSQFCFEDDFVTEIYTTHDQYSDIGLSKSGASYTTLASGDDTVFRSDYEDHLLTLEQNSDGTLLAFGQIKIDV